MKRDLTQQCYCGQNKSYDLCCKPYHQGQIAATPQALMRSRFSAFATANVSYIMQTQTATLNQNIEPEGFTLELQKQKWVKLEVLDAIDDTVTFEASMISHDILYTLKEQSQFEQLPVGWLYTKAISHEDSERKLNRNEPCSCGSGKKYKQCCQKG